MDKKYWLYLATLIGVIGFIYTVTSFSLQDVLNTVLDANTRLLAVFIVLAFAMWGVFTWVWGLLLSRFKTSYNWFSLYNARLAGLAISYVTPGPRMGGEVFRIQLLEGDNAKLLVASVLEKICLTIAGMILILLACISAPFLLALSQDQTLVIGGIAAVLVIAALYFTFRNSSFLDWAIPKLIHSGAVPDDYVDHVHDFKYYFQTYFREHQGLVVKATLISFLSKALLIVQIYVLLAAFGLEPSVFQSFILAAAVEAAYAIPSYMGLGFLDGGQASTAALLALPVTVGITIAFLIRLRDCIGSAYGLLVLGYHSYLE